MGECECSFPRITKSSSCFNMCSGVVNMKNVREFNIAQKGNVIISTIMYIFIVFVICLYYLIKKYI